LVSSPFFRVLIGGGMVVYSPSPIKMGKMA
jgi:hypothetical protein